MKIFINVWVAEFSLTLINCVLLRSFLDGSISLPKARKSQDREFNSFPWDP